MKTKRQFDEELQKAYSSIRLYLIERYAVTSAADLEFR
jgi:hypothetical protein